MTASSLNPLMHKLLRSSWWRGVFATLLLSSGAASADTVVVDLRSHGSGPTWFISFVVVPPAGAGVDPSALVVWGNPHAAGGAYETVGLVSTSATSYFGRVADGPVQQMHFDELAAGAPKPKAVMDALTLLVDESDFQDVYEVYGGSRAGTYFEDQTIAPGDSGARNHGIAQIISYYAGIGARLGESVPDTLHLAAAGGNDPPGLSSSFSPRVYLRNMLATATAQKNLFDVRGSWSGESFGKWANGHGRFWYLSGAVYEGEMHRGERRGRGTWQGTDGLTISGSFDGDEPTEANILFPDGDSFSGTLQNGRLVHGTYQWRDGTRYVGSFGLTEQMVDGVLTIPTGEAIDVTQGLPQSAAFPAGLPRVNRLFAYAIDISR